ncbi:phosphotransferase [Pseudarthrobacter sp. AG30]|uniref:phosphotransferase n=1 Tax=Pseudarthrobacter sp. AG30 TaxID=2249742 RepID=UPI001403EB12|nr:phosphotransferase [Pseudarthrobacter sp. AG30]
MSFDDVRSLLRSGYGREGGSIRDVSGEVATVCRVEVAQQVLAVKVLAASGQDGLIFRWQTAAMDHLRNRGIPVPGVLVDADGELLHASTVSGRPVLVQVSEWIQDPPLKDISDIDDDLLREVGGLVARVSVGLQDYELPPSEATHPWELRRSAQSIDESMPLLGPDSAKIAGEALRRFEGLLVPLLPELPRSVVHHDLHDSNLLIGTTGDARRGVTGVLDFGDMVYGYRVAELAVAGAYAARNVSDAPAALGEVVSGWTSVLPLTEAETRAVLPAAISRLAVNAAVWEARSNGTRAGYASTRMDGAHQALEQLLQVNNDDFARNLAKRALAPR